MIIIKNEFAAAFFCSVALAVASPHATFAEQSDGDASANFSRSIFADEQDSYEAPVLEKDFDEVSSDISCKLYFPLACVEAFISAMFLSYFLIKSQRIAPVVQQIANVALAHDLLFFQSDFVMRSSAADGG